MENRVHRILVADDNPGTLYSTCRVLRSGGFEVDEAVNGTQAQDLAKHLPDLVLLDINMPDMDGYEVCAQLRTRPETARVPIVHLSATLVDVADKVRGLEGGADAYLTHPIEPEVLLATVRAFLRAKDSEDAHRRSDAKYRAVFKNALNGIVLVDENLTIMDANPAICLILGREHDDMLGHKLSDFALEGQQQACADLVKTARTESTWQGRFPLQRPDGEVTQLEWSVTAGAVSQLDLVVVTDVTAETKIEAEKNLLFVSEREARQEAERANRLKDEFLATLSHELRTPLTAILGWSQVLKAGCSAEKFEEGLDSIVRNSLAQGQLISDLLDISRITSGKLRLDIEDVGPNDVIADAVAAMSHAAQAKNVTLTTHDDPSLPVIRGDRGRLVQVVWNLLSNAVRFTPAGGEVSVDARVVGHQLRVSVTDTGEGIDPEFLPFIFDRFRQADSGSTRVHGGLGIGLAIVRHLVEMHGGTVSASSQGKGKGSQFAFEVPLHWEQEPAWNGADHEPGRSPFTFDPKVSDQDLEGARILLVEDNEDARRLLKHILEGANASVKAVDTVDECLNVLGDFGPDVLISDIGLPKKDGIELIEEVHKRWPDKELPVIALTAFVSADDSRRLIEAGFVAHLPKPVDQPLLVRTILSVLHSSGNGAALDGSRFFTPHSSRNA